MIYVVRCATNLYQSPHWSRTRKPQSSASMMQRRGCWLNERRALISCIRTNLKWWLSERGKQSWRIYETKKRSQICWKEHAESEFLFQSWALSIRILTLFDWKWRRFCTLPPESSLSKRSETLCLLLVDSKRVLWKRRFFPTVRHSSHIVHNSSGQGLRWL